METKRDCKKCKYYHTEINNHDMIVEFCKDKTNPKGKPLEGGCGHFKRFLTDKGRVK